MATLFMAGVKKAKAWVNREALANHARVPIRLVAVDLDDTVWATWPVLDRCQERYYAWLAETFPLMAKHYPRDTFYALCMKIADKCPEHSHCLSTLRREALRFALRDPRVEEEVQTAMKALGEEDASIETAVVQPLFDRFITERSRVDGHLFDGAKEALLKLRFEGLPGGGVVPVVAEDAEASGAKMAGGAFAAATQQGGAAAKAAARGEGDERHPLRPIVVALTDGNADIKQTGLGGLFDLAVNPELAGGKKASGKPFDHVLALARAKFGLSEEQLSAAHCVHVGDSVASDISPGLAAGFRTVLVRTGSERSGTNTSGLEPGTSGAHVEIESVASLEEALVLLQKH